MEVEIENNYQKKRLYSDLFINYNNNEQNLN